VTSGTANTGWRRPQTDRLAEVSQSHQPCALPIAVNGTVPIRGHSLRWSASVAERVAHDRETGLRARAELVEPPVGADLQRRHRLGAAGSPDCLRVERDLRPYAGGGQPQHDVLEAGPARDVDRRDEGAA